MQPYYSADTVTAWKNFGFILSERSDFDIVDNLSITVHDFPMRKLTSFSVDDILFWRFLEWSSHSRRMPFNMEMPSSCLQYINSVLFELTLKPMPLAVCPRLCNGDFARAGVFAKSTRSSVEFTSIIVFAGHRRILAFFFSSFDLLTLKISNLGWLCKKRILMSL